MYRNLNSELIKWKNKETRKPLLIKGIRQCGKTYLMQYFGDENYSDVAYFTFENNDALHEVFEVDFDISRIIGELGILRGKVIQTDTLIIFDEIQECNKALTSLKYFAEYGTKYDVICAGSLLGVSLSKPLSFPVGKVEFLTLYPLSFMEFLLANGEDLMVDAINNQNANKPVPNSYVNKLENYLKQYYIVGGMPEAVDTWVRTKNIEEIDNIQKNILSSYELDFAKHAPSKDFTKLTAIWRSIPNQLGKENKKFIFSQVKEGLRAKDLEDSLEWLISAGLVYKVPKIEKPNIPISAYADQTYFKLYVADVGLLRNMAKVSPKVIMTSNSDYKEFKGALTENYVVGELVNIKNDNVYFWRSGNKAEVDLIFQNDDLIIPMEVKSEKNDRAKSLSVYINKYSPEIALKATMKNTADNNIPLYLIWRIQEKIKALRTS